MQNDDFPDFVTFAEQTILGHLLRDDPIAAQRSANMYHIKLSYVREKYSKEIVFAKLKQTC